MGLRNDEGLVSLHLAAAAPGLVPHGRRCIEGGFLAAARRQSRRSRAMSNQPITTARGGYRTWPRANLCLPPRKFFYCYETGSRVAWSPNRRKDTGGNAAPCSSMHGNLGLRQRRGAYSGARLSASDRLQKQSKAKRRLRGFARSLCRASQRNRLAANARPNGRCDD